MGKYKDLLEAAQHGDLPEVQCFIEREGADKNIRNLFGQTPLHLAAQNGHLAVVKYLITQGAEMEVFDDAGKTPLYLAAVTSYSSPGAKNHIEIVKYLNNLQNYYDRLPFLSSMIIGLMVGTVPWFVDFLPPSTSIAVSVTTGFSVEALRLIRSALAKNELNKLEDNFELCHAKEDLYFKKGEAAERALRDYVESFFWPMTYLPAAAKLFEAGRAYIQQKHETEMKVVQHCLQSNPRMKW